MIMKKLVMLGTGLLLIPGLLAACAAKTVGVETQLGTVVPDTELIASFSLESNEQPDDSNAGTDYMDYIRPLGYLLNGQSWAEPADISPDDILLWYAVYERDQNGVDLADFSTEDGIYRFSQQAVEDTVAKYFGSLGASLRGEVEEGRFDSETGEYIVRSELPDFTQSIHLTKAEDHGVLKKLYFTVTINRLKQEYILTLTDQDGAFLYKSLTGPEGETDTPALIALPLHDMSTDTP